MGLFDNWFKKVKPKFIYNTQPSRSVRFNKAAYEHETIRGCIDAIATHAAKAKAMHVVLDKDNRVEKVIHNSEYARLLNEKPNELMTGFDLKYKLVTHREAYTTAICYIKWDSKYEKPLALIPVHYSSFSVHQIIGGGFAIVLEDYNGEKYTLNIEDIIVLRKFFNTRDVSGDGNEPVYNVLDMLMTAEEGMKQALSVANKIRGLFKQKKSMLDPKDVEKSTMKFIERFNSAAESGGIVGIDVMEEYVPLDAKPWATTASQNKDIRDGILRYFRISNSILMSDYDEAQGQAFFESVIEPILDQFAQAATNAFFTKREREVGNRIIFSSASVISASLATRVNVLNATKETGELTTNERRELLGFPPIEDGDNRLVSLNYIKSTDQSKYQIGKEE